MFNWVCWIAPNNTVSTLPLTSYTVLMNPQIVNQIFGSISCSLGEMIVSPSFLSFRGGLGFSLFTFDWNEIAYIGSP